MQQPLIVLTRRSNGEYSTTEVSGMIETCWFGNDGHSKVIDRSMPPTHPHSESLRLIALAHVAMYEAGMN